MRQNKYEYDAFISHAVEDKIPIANELCARLEQAGLRIWYSGKELGVGDSIEKTIERGLNRSRYGIVIFSPTYLAKNWTIREFYTLLAKEIEEQKVILPVLYNITLDELKNKDLVMADRFAVSADRGLDVVVDRLMLEIRKPQVVRKKEAWFSGIWMLLILSLVANAGFLLKGAFSSPPAAHADFSSAPAEVRTSMDRAGSHPIIKEMQDLFNTINTCSCPHGGDRRLDGPAQAGFASIFTGGEAPAFVDASPAEQSHTNASGSVVVAPAKMTMSVVFQIEPAAPVEGQVRELRTNFDDNQGANAEATDFSENGRYRVCRNDHHAE